MLLLTPQERQAVLFVGTAFFIGLVLNAAFKLSPAAYARLQVLDEAPAPLKVDINRATYEQLLNVPGIGPSTAARIINARRERGRFASADDLRTIKRFSARSFAKARPHLIAGPP